jgi:hypothetical protein
MMTAEVMMSDAPEPSAPRVMYLYRRVAHRVKTTSRVEWAALERLRDAVYWLHQHGAAASLEQELTIAIEAHVAGLAARFHGNAPFPERPCDLTPGRRAGVHAGRHQDGSIAATARSKP